jgi:siroheme synthase (precorrin-2 oxidase/ferrochelatase)
MKNAGIVALVGVNVLFLVALVVGTGSVDQAKAQGYIEQDYIVIAAKVDKTEDVIYITDMKKKRMLAFQFDTQKKRMVPYRGVRLLRDFGHAD